MNQPARAACTSNLVALARDVDSTSSRVVRTLGTLYPAFVLLVVVATGNHFFVDAAAGALVGVPPSRRRTSG